MLAGVAPIAARQTKRLMVRADQPTDLVAHLDAEIELVHPCAQVARQRGSHPRDAVRREPQLHRALTLARYVA